MCVVNVSLLLCVVISVCVVYMSLLLCVVVYGCVVYMALLLCVSVSMCLKFLSLYLVVFRVILVCVCDDWLGWIDVWGILVDMGVGWGRYVRWGCGLCGWAGGWSV